VAFGWSASAGAQDGRPDCPAVTLSEEVSECRSAEEIASLEASERLYAEGLEHFWEGVKQSQNEEFTKALEKFTEASKGKCPYYMAVYYLGVTYGKLGCYDKAVRPLEKALQLVEKLPRQPGKTVASHPGFAVIHQDLAVAYHRTKNYEAARTHFDEALQADPQNDLIFYNKGLHSYAAENYPDALASLQGAKETAKVTLPPDRRDRIDTLAQQVQETQERRRRWGLRFGVGSGFDSNVILQPDEGPTVGQISNQDDFRFAFTVGGTLNLLPRSETSSTFLMTNYDFYQSLYTDLDDFNLQAHQFRLTGGWTPLEDLTLEVEGGTNYYRLGNDDYLHELYAMPALGYFVQPWTYTALSYRITNQNYLFSFFDPVRDGLRQELTVRQYFLTKPRDFRRFFFVGYQYVNNNPSLRAGNDFQYQGNLVEVGASFPVPVIEDMSVDLSYSFRTNDYTFANSRTNFTRARDDDIHDISVIFRKRLSKLLEVNVSYFGAFSDSNIGVFAYERHIISVALQVTY
jgi:tetratricopeptide (TPR) repeat protein